VLKVGPAQQMWLKFNGKGNASVEVPIKMVNLSHKLCLILAELKCQLATLTCWVFWVSWAKKEN